MTSRVTAGDVRGASWDTSLKCDAGILIITPRVGRF